MPRPELCRFCENRSKSPEGGCLHSEPGLPMMPSPDSECIFLKRGEPSRFELAERYKVEHGRVYVPYDVPSHPVAVLRPIPEDDGEEYSIVCRDGVGSFRVDSDGNTFSDSDDMKPIGHITDLDEETVSEEEMRESIEWLRKRMKELL